MNYGVYVAIALTGLVSSVGGAVTEIWIKPWFKKIKKKHELFLKKIKNDILSPTKVGSFQRQEEKVIKNG